MCTQICVNETRCVCVFVCVSRILIHEVWDMVQECGPWGMVHSYGVYQFVKQYKEEASDKALIMETEGGQD